MKINLRINEKYKVPEIHIYGSENTAELRNLYHTVKEAVEFSVFQRVAIFPLYRNLQVALIV